VLKNAVKSVEADTLVEIGDIDQTAFVNTSLMPNVAYEYRVGYFAGQTLGEPAVPWPSYFSRFLIRRNSSVYFCKSPIFRSTC